MMESGFLASFCVTHVNDVEREIESVVRLDGICSKRLRYYEIVYVVGEKSRDEVLAAGSKLSRVRNLRILIVSDDASIYRRRLIAASESIGDVVTLTDPGELGSLDVVDFAQEAISSNQVILAQSDRRPILPVVHWVLGALSSHRVNARDMKTLSLPRARLVALLPRPSAAIDLRFEAKRGLFPYVRRAARRPDSEDKTSLLRRAEFSTEIVSASSSRILKTFSVFSIFVMLVAILYGAYAVLIVFTLAEVEPGWFSTAVAQSGSVAFISLGLSAISLGLARVVERLDSTVEGSIIDEIGNINFFEEVSEINVESYASQTERTGGS